MRMLLLQQATPGLEREFFIDNLLVREREFFIDNLMVRGGEEEADASAAAGHPRSKP